MDWNANHDDESGKNYLELKNLLESALKKINKISDLRESKGLLIEVQNAFKGLKLQREKREELYGKLLDAFAEINKKIAQERSDFEAEAQYNYADFKLRIEEAQFLASHPKDFHETWDHLIEVQNAFKNARFLREHREELYQGLQVAFETLKKEQSAEKSKEIATSALTYNSLVEVVNDLLDRSSTAVDLRLHNDELIRIQASIREAKLVREHRDELLGKLQEAFLIIQIRLDEEFQQTRNESEDNFSRFKPQAFGLLDQSKTSQDFHLTRESIKSLQSDVRNARLLREQREELYAILQEAFTLLGERQDNEQESFQKDAGKTEK